MKFLRALPLVALIASGAAYGQSSETVSGFTLKAIGAATVELQRHNLRPTDYRYVTVNWSADYIFVGFYQRTPEEIPGHRGNTARPGEAPDIDIELDPNDLSIRYANFSR